ncbi:MAG: hypothetical protein JW857_08540 [Bacteroidales bacterium]|nr:hypothetical protein [Bacteroidales bacterium]
MKRLLFLSMLLMLMGSCKNDPKKASQNGEIANEYQSFTVKESMPAGGYVYILGDQDGELKWFAVSDQEVNEGEVFYFTDPLVMKDFYSKELDRPFEEIVFLSKVSKNADDLVTPSNRIMNKPSGKVTTDRLEIEIEVPADAISIQQLFEHKEDYQGKTVRVRGQVVKFSPEIMNTNWIHIQDGTAFDGKYDLTITSSSVVEVGDVLTFEGKIAVDKDFGYGYFYDVLMEAAEIKE